MSTLRDLVKDRKVYSINAEGTVLEAARFMMEHNIGALPVLRNGDLAGIFSERDIMNRVVAVGRTPGHTVVSEVMTANPRAVNLDETDRRVSLHHARVRLPASADCGRQGTERIGFAARHRHAPGRRTRTPKPARVLSS